MFFSSKFNNRRETKFSVKQHVSRSFYSTFQKDYYLIQYCNFISQYYYHAHLYNKLTYAITRIVMLKVFGKGCTKGLNE